MPEADDIITLTQGPYRLRASLGGSAYGVVWRAAAPHGQPDVALKLVNRSQMARAHPSVQTRWIDSADTEAAFLRALAPWDQRHIVRLIDSGAHQGLPVMALELLGENLGQHLESERHAGRTPGLARALGWIAQLNLALAKVHQVGWSYLDLKPANVLMHPSGGIKLADFGTSRLRASLPSAVYAGTAAWQAPEQFFPGASHHYHADARADLFSLGAMLFYLVTGGRTLAFCSACGQAYREHARHAPAALLARHHGSLPATLAEQEADLFTEQVARDAGSGAAASALALLRALLAPSPEARPRHALQVSRMLAAIGQPRSHA